MKYMNILAGAFGLMALAACTNTDEVTVEQPNDGVRTITVAYNQGANTRYDITDLEGSGTPSYAFQYAEGFKVSWTSGDKIDLIKDGVTYTYETQESGDVATFTLVGDTAPTTDGDYKVAFPTGWGGNEGGSTSFLVQDLEDFDVTKYLHATATATLSGGTFGDEVINLKPVFSFIYIPEDTEFLELKKYLKDDDTEYKEVYGILSGENLFGKIEDFEGATADIDGINFSNLGIGLNDEQTKRVSGNNYLIAVPVFEGKPITGLTLYFTNLFVYDDSNEEYNEEDPIYCEIRTSDGENDLTISEGGKIYRLSEDGEALFCDF